MTPAGLSEIGTALKIWYTTLQATNLVAFRVLDMENRINAAAVSVSSCILRSADPGSTGGRQA